MIIEMHDLLDDLLKYIQVRQSSRVGRPLLVFQRAGADVGNCKPLVFC
jgi:hypothetical protein